MLEQSTLSSAVMAGPLECNHCQVVFVSQLGGPWLLLGDHDCHGVVMAFQRLVQSWLLLFYVVDFYSRFWVSLYKTLGTFCTAV